MDDAGNVVDGQAADGAAAAAGAVATAAVVLRLTEGASGFLSSAGARQTDLVSG